MKILQENFSMSINRKKTSTNKITKAKTNSISKNSKSTTTATLEDVPKDCPVLNVKTNLAEYLLIFNEYAFKNGVVSNEVSAENNIPAKIMLGNPLLMFFAKELAKGLCKSLAKQTKRKKMRI